MRRNLTLALATLAIGAAVAATYLATPTTHEDGLDSGGALLGELAGQLDQIRRVEVIQDGETQVDVRLDDERGWALDSMHGFAANFEALDRLVSGLAEARVESAKTAKPERYAQLGLDETDGALRVRISAEDRTLAEVVLGDIAAGGQGQYLRLADEPTSWQVHNSVDASAEPSDWLRSEILDIDAQRVRRVAFDDGSALSRADASAPMQLSPMPEGKQIRYARALDHYARGLSGVRVSGVLPAERISASIVQSSVEFTTFDHLVIRCERFLQDGEPLWRLAFSVADALDGETHPEQFKLRAEEAEQMNAQHAPWGYALDDASASQWELSLSGALSDVEPEEDGD